MHIIFSIFDKFGKFKAKFKKAEGGVQANQPTSQPANQTPETPDKQINLTRNFHKNGKKFMSKYKNSLKVSLF